MSIEKYFNNYKNTLYKNNYTKYKLTELASLILSENKTEEEITTLEKIYDYATSMEDAVRALGTKVGIINSSLFSEMSEDNCKKIDEHAKDIVESMDYFIDALSAFTRLFEFGNTKFILKNSTAYLKAMRNEFIQTTNEFKIKMIQNKNDEFNFISIINDEIDMFLKESYSLRLSILTDKIKQVLDDSKHSNN